MKFWQYTHNPRRAEPVVFFFQIIKKKNYRLLTSGIHKWKISYYNVFTTLRSKSKKRRRKNHIYTRQKPYIHTWRVYVWFFRSSSVAMVALWHANVNRISARALLHRKTTTPPPIGISRTKFHHVLREKCRSVTKFATRDFRPFFSVVTAWSVFVDLSKWLFLLWRGPRAWILISVS